MQENLCYSSISSIELNLIISRRALVSFRSCEQDQGSTLSFHVLEIFNKKIKPFTVNEVFTLSGFSFIDNSLSS
jgi:hypothetical protein